MRFLVLIGVAALSTTTAWMPSTPAARRGASRSALSMAIDYNDPVVAEEFAKVQPMTYEEVEAELQESGIRASAAMNEMDVKLMLVEMRMRLAGKMDGGEPKKRPTKFSSKLEEALWTKPAFEELYIQLKQKDDHNSMNVVAEYLNDPAMARRRYEKTYKGLLRKVDKAMTAPPPVKSPTLQFSGFPANMGEAGCRMTLESIGSISEFECAEDSDFPVLKGKVTFDDIESAKAAVAQYHGMDMGMGTSLELVSL
eukprot:scaffold2830_cov131-Cylindrotheca_fusiformis.AAC.38